MLPLEPSLAFAVRADIRIDLMLGALRV